MKEQEGDDRLCGPGHARYCYATGRRSGGGTWTSEISDHVLSGEHPEEALSARGSRSGLGRTISKVLASLTQPYPVCYRHMASEKLINLLRCVMEAKE